MADFSDYIDISGGDGGILKKITEEGEGGSPQIGDEVVAHYTGMEKRRLACLIFTFYRLID